MVHKPGPLVQICGTAERLHVMHGAQGDLRRYPRFSREVKIEVSESAYPLPAEPADIARISKEFRGQNSGEFREFRGRFI